MFKMLLFEFAIKLSMRPEGRKRPLGSALSAL